MQERPIYYRTAVELAQMLEQKEVSSEELLQSVLDRKQEVDGRVRAFLHLDAEDALQQARASDARLKAGQSLGPLDGIPVALKDVLAVEGQPLTCASRILQNYVSPYTGTAMQALRDAGAVLYGRLNLDEFAMGSSTENSAYQVTANPWDLQAIPGGSSGGSAAVVAAGESIISVGSDTGGSIRQPAALCGVVGVKPTYGRISRYGLAAFASSLDQIGPFTRCVEDAALFLDVTCHHDPKDSTSIPAQQTGFQSAVKSASLKGLRIGLPEQYYGEGLQPEVRAAIEAAHEFCRREGATIVPCSLPHTEYAVPVYYILATAEASSNLARYDGVRYTTRSSQASDGIDLYFKSRGEGFGEEVKRRIMLGTYVLSSGYYDAYYGRAQKVRRLIWQEFQQAFGEVDCLLTPTTPTTAFKRGEKADDPLAMYLSDIFTISANLAGLPALSQPCGFDSRGLPIGMQWIGPVLREDVILSAAAAFERAHDFHRRMPPL